MCIRDRVNIADTSTMLSNRFARDTASLSNRINTKVNIADTSTMLSNRFARDTASLSNRINSRLNISDTSTMLSNRFARDTASLSNRINTKVNIADTSAMLSNRFARDTVSLSNRINNKLNIADAGFTVEVTDEPTATAGQTSFTLSHSVGANSKVKMYFNGIRISNSAYTTSGTTVTYNPSGNGSYTILSTDRIQFDFSY